MVTLVNRAKMTTATTGTGSPLTLGSAVDGFQTFAAAGVSNGNTVRYAIEDGTNWEIGTGVYTASGTTLTRVVQESSNSDAAINLSGDAIVFVTATNADFIEKPIGSVSGNATLDLSTGTIFEHTPTANTTFVFSNPPASGTGYEFNLKVTGVGIPSGDYYNIVDAAYDDQSLTVGLRSAFQTFVFNDDGTKMYAANALGASKVHQYSLTTAYDISTASYDGVYLYTISQESRPAGLAFNSDGTKVFIVGYVSDSVFQYSLTTAYDLSTASYDNVSLNVSAQDGLPVGVSFKADGTKMYVLGRAGTVYQYSLSTGFDLSTASYDSVSFAVSSQETVAWCAAFNASGTKMYIVGSGTDSVYQYSLSTAWDLSTAAYDSVTISVASQDANPYGVTFKPDGTKMYVTGGITDTAYQYSLSTSYDLSTASYDSVSFKLNLLIPTAQDIKFNADGTKAFVLALTGAVYQYSLSTGFDLTTASYDSVSFDVSSQDGSCSSLLLNSNGTKFYVVGNNNDSVFQYSLSTAYDLSTASYDSVSFSAATQTTSVSGGSFNNDGTKMYVYSSFYLGPQVFQYSLSTAYDLSTASYDSVSLDTSSQDSSVVSVLFNSDGTKVFVVSSTSESVYRYSLSTAYNIGTASYDSVSFDISGQTINSVGGVFSPNGSHLFVVDGSYVGVHKYTTEVINVATLTYPASVKWPSGTKPADPAVGEVDLLKFLTTDGGATYYGYQAGNAFS